jgi:hypothetical protein
MLTHHVSLPPSIDALLKVYSITSSAQESTAGPGVLDGDSDDKIANLRVVADVAADVMAVLQNEIWTLRVGRIRGECLRGENHSNREGDTR